MFSIFIAPLAPPPHVIDYSIPEDSATATALVTYIRNYEMRCTTILFSYFQEPVFLDRILSYAKLQQTALSTDPYTKDITRKEMQSAKVTYPLSDNNGWN